HSAPAWSSRQALAEHLPSHTFAICSSRSIQSRRRDGIPYCRRRVFHEGNGWHAMRFLVFQHAAVEHPGVLRDFLRADCIPWDAIELDQGAAIPPLEGYDALMVLGGPMDVWQEDRHPWLAREKVAIRQWVNGKRA